MAYRNKQDWHTKQEACEHCGDPLTGEQARFCSANCRAKHRYHAGKTAKTRPCEVCGEPITTADLRKTRCTIGTGDDADAGPGDRCWDLQNEEENRRREAIDARDFPECAHCGAEAEYAGRGRHRKYCSDRCRVYAHRARKGRKTPANRHA